jgi:hypothetical protein
MIDLFFCGEVHDRPDVRNFFPLMIEAHDKSPAITAKKEAKSISVCPETIYRTRPQPELWFPSIVWRAGKVTWIFRKRRWT